VCSCVFMCVCAHVGNFVFSCVCVCVCLCLSCDIPSVFARTRACACTCAHMCVRLRACERGAVSVCDVADVYIVKREYCKQGQPQSHLTASPVYESSEGGEESVRTLLRLESRLALALVLNILASLMVSVTVRSTNACAEHLWSRFDIPRLMVSQTLGAAGEAR
jgi:hypothetical protein